MGIDDAATAVIFKTPGYYAMHYNTFEVIEQAE